MTEAAAPTTGDQEVNLRERALGPVVTNLSIAPLWLVPFTVLVSLLTRAQNDALRLQIWIGCSLVATIVIILAVAAYRRAAGRADTSLGGAAHCEPA